MAKYTKAILIDDETERIATLEQLNRDACDTDTEIRELIRPTGIDVDGNSYGVPPVGDLIEQLVDKYMATSGIVTTTSGNTMIIDASDWELTEPVRQ